MCWGNCCAVVSRGADQRRLGSRRRAQSSMELKLAFSVDHLVRIQHFLRAADNIQGLVYMGLFASFTGEEVRIIG